MASYPGDHALIVRAGRFLNVLDDADNKLSPVKLNVWGANLAGFSTAAAAVLAWISGHWAMLEHVTQIGALVGPYLGAAHTAHHMDKRDRNLQVARMK
jgi:hypothetical protein